MLKLYKYLSVLFFNFKCHTSVLPRSAEAQMLDLQRPRNSTRAPTSTDWRPWFRPGVTRPQKRGRSGVWEGVLCRSHQKVTNVGGCEEIFTTFSTHHVESFGRERLPFGRRTRTTQEKPISEFHEVTGPTGPARAKGHICVHK